MVVFSLELTEIDAEVVADFAHYGLTVVKDRRCQGTAAILSDEHQMRMALPYSVPATSNRVIISHDANSIIC